ncbi:MAG: S1C family serine protease [Rhodospirillales bacterium]|jgi:S1-C subfamily serine protease|nr:S1C family serine protease [Rhodospirillales bacterium]MDP6644694.1 S1C family serine protease [Rhodospirillales bacterium]MDP6842066.1 S1C family serine protease [Rhodospirillales bacterium]
MTGIERANGHRPSGLLHLLDPTLKLAPHPKQEDLSFDLDNALASVLRLGSEVPEEAFSARTLGTERQGNGIKIDDDNFILTIGYLVVDASRIVLNGRGGQEAEAELVGYSHETGLAVIHALQPLDLPSLPIGGADDLKEKEAIIIAPYGGAQHSISGAVASRREFAGSWEYMLDRAIFTTPIHPNWSGAALIRGDGKLAGVGSLWVNDAEKGKKDSQGNMFVPIDLLKPIYEDLITVGRARGPMRPWIGMYTAEAMGRLFVSGIIPDGPSEMAGVEAGDLITGINDQAVTSLVDMYGKLWASGEAGVEVLINLRRDGEDIDIAVKSESRYTFMDRRRSH